MWRCSTGSVHETATSRDSAARRLRRTTSITLAAAGALVAAFAGLAARALPGHHTVKATQVRTTTKRVRATPPPLVAVQSAATPAPPPAPPAQTQSPPVVVSGGT
jgi:hypothetical protein